MTGLSFWTTEYCVITLGQEIDPIQLQTNCNIEIINLFTLCIIRGAYH